MRRASLCARLTLELIRAAKRVRLDGVVRPQLTENDMTDQEQELPGMLALAEGVNAGEWPHTMDAQVWAQKWL